MNWNINETIKDIGITLFKVLLCVVLLVFIAVCCVGAFTDKHVKIGFIEFNGQKKTEQIEVSNKNKDTPSIIPNPKKEIIDTPNKEFPAIKIKKRSDEESKTNPTQPMIFNGPTQVGDNNTQNNNFTTPPRIATSEIIDDILKHIKRGVSVMEVSRKSAEEESEQFSKGIVDSLRKRGFKAYYVNGIATIGETGISRKPQEIIYEKSGNILMVIIPSNK